MSHISTPSCATQPPSSRCKTWKPKVAPGPVTRFWGINGHHGVLEEDRWPKCLVLMDGHPPDSIGTHHMETPQRKAATRSAVKPQFWTTGFRIQCPWSVTTPGLPAFITQCESHSGLTTNKRSWDWHAMTSTDPFCHHRATLTSPTPWLAAKASRSCISRTLLQVASAKPLWHAKPKHMSCTSGPTPFQPQLRWTEVAQHCNDAPWSRNTASLCGLLPAARRSWQSQA